MSRISNAATHAYHGGNVFSVALPQPSSATASMTVDLVFPDQSYYFMTDISGWLMTSSAGIVAADIAGYRVINPSGEGVGAFVIPTCLDVLNVPYAGVCQRDPDTWTFFHRLDASGGYHGTVAASPDGEELGTEASLFGTTGVLDDRLVRLHIVDGLPLLDTASTRQAREVSLAAPAWSPWVMDQAEFAEVQAQLLDPKTYAFTTGAFGIRIPGFKYDYVVGYQYSPSGQAVGVSGVAHTQSPYQLASANGVSPATWSGRTIIAAPVAVDANEDLVMVPLMSHSWNSVANDAATWRENFRAAHGISAWQIPSDLADAYVPLMPLPMRQPGHPNRMNIIIETYEYDGDEAGLRLKLAQRQRTTVTATGLPGATSSVGRVILKMIESARVIEPLADASLRTQVEAAINGQLCVRLTDAFSDPAARSFLLTQLVSGQHEGVPGMGSEADGVSDITVTFAEDVLRGIFNGAMYVFINADVRVAADDDRVYIFRFPVRFSVVAS